MKAFIQVGSNEALELAEEFNSLEELSAFMHSSGNFSNPVIAGDKIIFESKLSDEEGFVFGFAHLEA